MWLYNSTEQGVVARFHHHVIVIVEPTVQRAASRAIDPDDLILNRETRGVGRLGLSDEDASPCAGRDDEGLPFIGDELGPRERAARADHLRVESQKPGGHWMAQRHCDQPAVATWGVALMQEDMSGRLSARRGNRRVQPVPLGHRAMVIRQRLKRSGRAIGRAMPWKICLHRLKRDFVAGRRGSHALSLPMQKLRVPRNSWSPAEGGGGGESNRDQPSAASGPLPLAKGQGGRIADRKRGVLRHENHRVAGTSATCP